DAENQLDHLQMKENHHINKYVVEFNWIASQVWGYRDGALCHHFYLGLPDHIKDEICHVGKLQNLNDLCHLAQEIDACYWECQDEVQHASKHQSSSTSKPSNPGGNTSNPASNSTKPSQGKSKTGSTTSKLATSSQLASGLSNPEPSKLGKDSKLTPEECKR